MLARARDTEEMRDAFVAIGSNLRTEEGGRTIEPLEQVSRAIDLLRGHFAHTRASHIYQTEPVGCEPGSPPFINAVACFPTRLAPHELLSALRALEQSAGRPAERTRNAPRTLDLDLIALGNIRVDDPVLTLPHPRAHERVFVLRPLADLAPALRLPGQTLTVEALLAELRDAGQGIARVMVMAPGEAPDRR